MVWSFRRSSDSVQRLRAISGDAGSARALLPIPRSGHLSFVSVSITDGTVTELCWFEVGWVCGSVAGVRHVRAPDAQSAEHDLERHPSDYGLPHETALIGRARRLALPITEDLL
jgi:hypothetical protein